MKYEIRKRGDGKQAIFDETGKQISPGWYDEIYPSGLIKGQSPYYKVKKGNRTAIFDKDGKQITKWFYRISSYGLVSGESDLYIANATKRDGKWAIFNKDGRMISPEWFDDISPYGLVGGRSIYYIARKGWEEAIFDVNGNRITDFYSEIYPDGLVKGQSNLYIARKDGKEAIFDVNGNRITEWFDTISPYGLVEAKSDYYIACNEDQCAVYYKDGRKVSEDFFEKYIKFNEIIINENLGIVEIKKSHETITIDFNPVYPFKEEIIDYTKLLNI